MKKSSVLIKRIALFISGIFIFFSSVSQENKNSKAELSSNNLPVLSSSLFRKNVGQWQADIRYSNYNNGRNINFLNDGISFGYLREKENSNVETNNGSGRLIPNMEMMVWNFRFIGSDVSISTIESNIKTDSKVNYINQYGTFENVPDHSEIMYKNIYSGIDLKYYDHNGKVKYDFIVQPNAKVERIQLKSEGVESLSVNERGELEIKTPWGIVAESTPYSYQIINGETKVVDVHFKLVDQFTYGFEVEGNYDKNFPLIIDPVILDWGTYMNNGATNALGYQFDITLDASNNVYGTGWHNAQFPTTAGVYNGDNGLANYIAEPGFGDVFVYKLSSSGQTLQWATFVGGSVDDVGRGIKVNAAGQVYVAGATSSANFPTTASAFDKTFNGPDGGMIDAVVFKLNASGTGFIYSTFLGGDDGNGDPDNTPDGNDWGLDVDINSNGEAFVTGFTNTPNFPTTAGAIKTANTFFSDAFITRLNSSGSGLIYSTLLGGNQYDYATGIIVDASNNAFVIGNTSSSNFQTTTGTLKTSLTGSNDDFVAKINSTGSSLIYSTLIGGSDRENFGNFFPIVGGFCSYYPSGQGFAVNTAGEVFITGTTRSSDFPVTAGAAYTTFKGTSGMNNDAYVARLNSTGTGFIYATFLGGAGADGGFDVAINNNEAFVVGITDANNFPTTPCSFKPNKIGQRDIYFSKFNSSGTSVLYSTYLGGTYDDYNDPSICLIDTGCYIRPVIGFTSHSVDAPTTSSAYRPNAGSDGDDKPFVLKLRPKINPGFTAAGGGGGCSGSTFTFTDTTSTCGLWTNSLYKHNWTFGDGQTGTGVTVNHTYASAGTYTVTLTVGCPDSTIQKIINVSSGGGISLTSSSTPVKCFSGNDGTATIAATGGTSYNYLWSTGSTQSQLSNLTSQTYTVTVTDVSSCTATTTVILSQPTILNVTSGNTNAGCSPTGSVYVNVTGGTAGYTYSWSNGSTSQTVNGLSAATYIITVSDNNNCSHVTIATVASGGGSISLSASVNPISCFGGNDGAASVAVAGGSGQYTYVWSNGVTSITSSPNNFISSLLSNVYTVTVNDVSGCSTATTLTITSPTDISIAASSTNATCGNNNGSAFVTSTTGGNGGFVYTWSGGTSGVTAVNLIGGNYIVTVTDSKNCSKTTSAIVNNSGGPSVVLTAKNNSTCFGSANGSIAVTGSGGSGTYTYIWSTGSTNSSISNLQGGNYVVTVNDGGSCPAIASYTINEPPEIIISTSSSNTACGASSGQVSVTSSGGIGILKYVWSTGSTSQTVNNLSAGNYNVTVSDGNNCTRSASTIISSIGGPTATITSITNILCFGGNTGKSTVTATGGSGMYTYNWSNGVSDITGNSQSQISNLTSQIYSVTVMDANNCISVTATSLTQPSQLNFTTSPSQSICVGQSATLSVSPTGGTPNYLYSWLPGAMTSSSITVNPIVTTTYTVAVADANGCFANTQTITITTGIPLKLNAINSQTVCVGSSASFVASASGGNSNYTYSWSTGSTGNTINVTPASSSSYTVTVSDGCSIPVTTSVSTFVNQKPNVIFNADVVNGCAPLVVSFTNLTANATSCRWDFGDGTGSSVCGANHQFNSPGNYNITLTVIDNNGCSGSYINNNMINVYGLPIADFSMSSNKISMLEPTVNFYDNSTGAVTWLWNFGDPNDAAFSSLKNPSHTYSDTGNYCVGLKVTNVYGCTDSTTGCLYVEPEYSIYIPNAFSPNNDGLNDIFFVKGTNLKKLRLWVFDRWGDQIYEGEGLNGQGWNGKANGGSEIAQQDVYVYKIAATDIHNRSHNYVGHVTLVK